MGQHQQLNEKPGERTPLRAPGFHQVSLAGSLTPLQGSLDGEA